MSQLFVPYKNVHRLERIERLAKQHNVDVGLPDYYRRGFVDLTGDPEEIRVFIHEVDNANPST